MIMGMPVSVRVRPGAANPKTNRTMERKFKVGDKCRIVKSHCNVYYDVGDVVEVDYVNISLDVTLPYRCRRIKGGKIQNVAESQLELITEPASVAHAFTVGETVKVIDHHPENDNETPTWLDSMDAFCGRVGIVDEICTDGILRVRFGNDLWFYRSEWLISYTESSIAAVLSTPDIFPIMPPSGFLRVDGSAWQATVKSDISMPLIKTTKLLTNINLD